MGVQIKHQEQLITNLETAKKVLDKIIDEARRDNLGAVIVGIEALMSGMSMTHIAMIMNSQQLRKAAETN